MVGFRTRARAVDLLGRQQIASLPTALSELFKNAHDAYATQARADFYRRQNLLAVTDDGIGMDRETFENSWLTIATESKLDRTQIKPPSGMAERTQLGQKGIGRFAIGALGRQVLVVSRRDGHRAIAALVNWEMFALPNVDLDQVPVGLIELANSKLTPADVEELSDPLHRVVRRFREMDGSKKWQEKLDRIESDLDGIPDDPYGSLPGVEPLEASGSHFLITPVSEDFTPDLGASESEEEKRESQLSRTLHGFTNRWLGGDSTPDFTVEFFDHRPGGDTEQLLDPGDFFDRSDFDEADHHIVGDFNESGHFSGVIRIFDEEPVDVEIRRHFRAKPLCGPFRFELGVVQGQRSESRLELGAFNEMYRRLRLLGGIYVYMDGVRVQPYGRPDRDYLEIEERRSFRASTYYFSHRRMFGAVSLTSEYNGALEEKAGREGFVEGRVYTDFRRLLMNLLDKLAAEFFRSGGPQVSSYEKGRRRLKHAESLRRTRDRRATKGRQQTGAALAGAVNFLDSTDIQAKASRIVQSTKASLDSDDDLLSVIDRISGARHRLNGLLDPLRIGEPEGFALTDPMRRDLAIVETRLEDLEKSVIATALADLNELAVEAGSRLTEGSEAEMRSFIKRRLASARSAVDAAEAAGKQALASLQSEVEKAICAESKTFREALEALQWPAFSSNAEWLRDQANFESKVDKLTRNSQQFLRRICNRIEASRLVFSLEAATLTELAAAADAEILELRAQADDQLEFVQLGMALAVVDHEFRTTISSFRSDVRRVGEWAKLNPPMRSLYDDLRRDFDHLDSYLTLLTPLQRRIRRTKTTIKGVSIVRFLEELFRGRLEETKTRITATKAFRSIEIEGYTSTFYPVFINLADNSLYWFSRISAESNRRIELDARGQALIYSDTGLGIGADIADRVFDFGFTTRPGGSGLGLAIAKQVLERAGWSIELGKHDQGAEFLIAPRGGNL